MAWLATLTAAGLALTASAMAMADSARFNIAAQPMPQALRAFAAQAHMQLLYEYRAVMNAKSTAVVGELDKHAALDRLLRDSGLEVIYSSESAATIRPKATPTSSTGSDDQPPSAPTNPTGGDAPRLDQESQGNPPAKSSSADQKAQSAPPRKSVELEEVLVTGSRLQQAAREGPQEVKVYSQVQIEESGQTTVADFLNTLPEVSTSSTETGFQLFSTATTVTLHGLPVGTTLVLINGRRVETSGTQGATGVFDLNNIPVAAVDRIEVVPTGSSAVYGSDAIAGVVNILLKKDFSGIEAFTKYGGASGTNESDSGVALGAKWARGSASLIGSYQARSALEGAERPLTATGDYRNFGGPNGNQTECRLANVYSADGISPLPGLGGATVAAVPAGFTGPPSIAEFTRTANTLNTCADFANSSFIPAMHRSGVFAQADYQLTDAIDIFAEFLGSHVQEINDSGPSELFGEPGFQSFTVSADNPYNPFGTTVGISGEFQNVRTHSTFDTNFIRPLIGVRTQLGGSWAAEVSAWDSTDKTENTRSNTRNTAAVQAALNSSNPATALNPFIDGVFGSPQLLNTLFVDQRQQFTGREQSVNGFVHGTLLSLESGDVQFVGGGEYDRTSIPQLNAPQRRAYALFTEAKIPIVASRTHPEAGDVLAVNLAGRYDHYSDFGSHATPQIGIELRPAASILLRGSYGTSFRAPPVQDLYFPPEVIPGFPVTDPKSGQEVPVVAAGGGNPNLRPTEGRATTVGIVYSSLATQGLRASLTYWKIDESNSIEFLAPQTLVDNEAFFPQNVIRDASGTITKVIIGYANFGTIDVAGLDYDLSYKLQTSVGTFLPSISATQTYKYLAQLVPGSPASDRTSKANDDGNFAPRWKLTAAVNWKLGDVVTNVAGRYVGRYRDYDPLPSGTYQTLGNFWLYDFNVRYAAGHAFARDKTWLSGAYIEAGGVNIFNSLPQYSNNKLAGAVGIGYDPAEADLRGRFLYAKVGLRW